LNFSTNDVGNVLAISGASLDPFTVCSCMIG
jgi:hypothetical protein